MYVVSLVSLVVLPRKLPPLHQSRHRLNNFLFVAFFAILCTLVSPLELFGDCDLHLCTTSEMSTAQAVPFPASERKTMYRFATYNIRYDNPSDGCNSWENRKSTVSRFLGDALLTVFGLQEALLNQVHDIASQLPAYDWLGQGRDGGSYGELNPIFYRKEEVKVLRSGTFWLSDTPEEVGSKFNGAALPRICTWAQFQSIQAEEKNTFYFFNTHFSHVSNSARESSSRLILKRIAKLCSPSDAVMLTGDLNSLPSSTPYSILTSSFLKDAFTQQRKQHLPTFPDFHGKAKMTIDYVFYKGFALVNASVLDLRTPSGMLASDHRPLTVEMD